MRDKFYSDPGGGIGVILTCAELNRACSPSFASLLRARRRLTIADEIAFELQLACDEAATNVIQHGYEGMNPGSIDAGTAPAAERIKMLLSDFGHPFEPVETQAPDVNAICKTSQPQVSGFILFIRR